MVSSASRQGWAEGPGRRPLTTGAGVGAGALRPTLQDRALPREAAG